jgi:hypothetical protein
MSKRPWTAADAESHNAALKGKAKLAKRWADTANGTLQSETEKGTEQTKAEGIAIATANKAVSRAHMGNSGVPEKPVRKKRTVTDAPGVTRTDPTDPSHPADSTMRTRAGQLSPASIDLDEHSVEAVLGTERACLSTDLKTNKSFLEVYLMSGAVFARQVPLCDTHRRDSVTKVLGSVRDIRVEGDHLVGRVFVDTNCPVWSKIRDGHITDVSWGVQPLETTEIKAGQSKDVQGRSFTAPADRSLFVHSKWRLREESITPIGSDERAKIRSLSTNQENAMNELNRAWLEENYPELVRSETTAEEAQAVWDGLPAADRTRAEESCREADDDEDDDEEDDDEDHDDKETPAKKKARMTREAKARKARAAKARAAGDEGQRIRAEQAEADAERIREEATEAATKKERKRVASIKRLAGKDVEPELVSRAIDEGWGISRVRAAFLTAVRTGRTASVGGGGNTDQVEMVRSLFGSAPAGHVRSHETDCTVATLSAAMLTRSYHGGQDVCNILGGYRPSASMISDESGRQESGQCYTVRNDVTRMLSGQARQASEERRRASERLLDLGDRYRGMSMLDLVDECNRIEGRARTTYDADERIRAAFSGSALSAIFTQNVSAQFLGGYLDAADTTVGWVTESDVPNFLQNERAIYGKMGQLERLGKGGTAADLDTSDWNEVYKIYRYAGKFVIDEQDFINDRFGALAQMSPQDMGLSARQIRPNLVYATLLQNPTLNQDSQALFNSGVVASRSEGNIVTGQITDFNATTPTASAGPMQDGISLMGKQRLRNRVLNLRPRFAIAGLDLEWALNVLLKSQQRIISSGSGGTYNPLAAAGIDMETRLDSRLDPLGVYCNADKKTYYPWTTTGATTGRSRTCILAARPGEQGAKTMEVGYRIGTGRAPRIRSSILREGSGQYGMSWDVNLDIGVQVLDFRGFVLINGGDTQLAASGPAQS